MLLDFRREYSFTRRKASSYWKELIGKFLCLFVCICEIPQLLLWSHFMFTPIDYGSCLKGKFGQILKKKQNFRNRRSHTPNYCLHACLYLHQLLELIVFVDLMDYSYSIV